MALALAVGDNGWQSAQLDFPTQGIDDPQNIFKSQGGLPGFKVNNEAHANPCCQSQLGLRQPELLAGSSKDIAELLR